MCLPLRIKLFLISFVTPHLLSSFHLLIKYIICNFSIMWPYWVTSVWKVLLWKVRSCNRLSILKLITQNLCSSGSPTDTCFYFCITGYVFQQKNRLLILLFIIYCALESVLILWFIIYCALESVIDIVIYYTLCTLCMLVDHLQLLGHLWLSSFKSSLKTLLQAVPLTFIFVFV